MLNTQLIDRAKKDYGQKSSYASERLAYWERASRRASYESANPYERMALDKALF